MFEEEVQGNPPIEIEGCGCYVAKRFPQGTDDERLVIFHEAVPGDEDLIATDLLHDEAVGYGQGGLGGVRIGDGEELAIGEVEGGFPRWSELFRQAGNQCVALCLGDILAEQQEAGVT